VRRRNVLLAVSLAVILVLALLYALARPRPERAFFARGQDVLILAHQGGDRLWPGNTLYAFERAAALGADVLELDIHASRDGHLVVIHDDTVDRITNGTGRVGDLTLAELQALDAGYRWSPERTGSDFPYRGRGVGIPTLDEVLTAFPDHRVNIEIKPPTPGVAGPLCALIRERGRAETVLVGSFHHAALREFRAACPEVVTSASPREVLTFYVLHRAFLARFYTPAADAFQVPERQGGLRVVTPRFVADARAKNVDVHVWTVDDADDMERLIGYGVDGIITDRPDRLARVLGRPVDAPLPAGVPE
jgi:glycerophosphoryl diester phosphodiesterase